jgi:hypothetical protein
LTQVFKTGEATVYIETLSPYRGYGPGHYKMAALKQTTGTQEFQALSDSKKKCKLEDQNWCNAQNWLFALRDVCKCRPTSLAGIAAKVTRLI